MTTYSNQPGSTFFIQRGFIRFLPEKSLSLATLLLLLGPASLLYAQETVSFQGRLTWDDGRPVEDGAYAVAFLLYPDGDTGEPLWQETHTVITRGGVFSAVLGADAPLNLSAFDAMPYLALRVDGEPPGARLPLSPSPYALTARRIDDEALVAGENVTITRQADGRLEIAAGAGIGKGGASSTSGAMMVLTDATLVGDGTAGAPLGVAVPLVLTATGFDAAIRGESGTGNYGKVGDFSHGVYGYTPGSNGDSRYGVYGVNNHGGSPNVGYLAGDVKAIEGTNNAHHTGGHIGSDEHGAYGWNTHLNSHGYLGGDYGAYGFSRRSNSDNYGFLGDAYYGAYGRHGKTNNWGYLGSTSYGVQGWHGGTGNYGYLGGSSFGVYGRHGTYRNYGILGLSSYGVYGRHGSNVNTYGYLGGNGRGVFGFSIGGHAGYFVGKVHVSGTLSKGGGSFKIDHPLDPANRYLAHSFVESPDMMNVYNGTVTTDARGEAVVVLPAYFEALNRDFRYQLTAIGAPGPNLYIAETVKGNQFKIAGGAPGMEVSWQVTGIRQDRWAEENRIVVEEAKPSVERGFYLHPQLYGQPAERSVEWVRDPEGMRVHRELPALLEAEQRRIEQERQRLDDERARIEQARERRRDATPPPGDA